MSELGVQPQGGPDTRCGASEGPRTVPSARRSRYGEDVNCAVFAFLGDGDRVWEKIKVAMEVNHLTPCACRNAPSSSRPRRTRGISAGAGGQVIDFHCHLDLFPDPVAVARACKDHAIHALSVTTTTRARDRTRA